MADRWESLDARGPRLLAILKGMGAEAELAARMALSRISAQARGDRAWKARMAELPAAVVHSTDDLVRVMARARAIGTDIRAALNEGGSDLA
jgi:hypothetical protein